MATHEFVVPRSMPITLSLAMAVYCSLDFAGIAMFGQAIATAIQCAITGFTGGEQRRTSARSCRSSAVSVSFSLFSAIAMTRTSSASASLPAARNAVAKQARDDGSFGLCACAFFAYSSAVFGWPAASAQLAARRR